MKNFTVFETAHIDGGAYRAVRFEDGSERVEKWTAKGWVPRGTTFWEMAHAPPLGAAFARRLGIPTIDWE